MMDNPEIVGEEQAPGAEFSFDPSEMMEAVEETEPEIEAQPEETEEVVEEESENEPAELEAAEEDPEPEDTTPRAQKRIQKLANQKKELAAENDRLNALIEQLQKSNELQSKMQERQQAYWDQQDQANKDQQRVELMRRYGLDPNDQKDAIAYESIEYKSELEQKIEQLQSKLEEQEKIAQFERFNQALDQQLNTALKSYNVDEDTLTAIRETAFDYADLKRATAAEAAEAAIKRYQKILPKKKASRAAKVDAAAKAVTMGNRSKGKAAGQPASSDADWLSMLDSGEFVHR